MVVSSLLVPSLLSTPSVATPAPQAVAAAPDFATNAWSDAWDYSNPSDIILDNSGPAMGLTKATISSGLLTYTVAKQSYISPLWAGYPGALLLGRDGGIQANMVDAGYYSDFSMHVYSSATLSVALQWFSCGAATRACLGGMPFHLNAGWNDLSFTIRNNPKLAPNGKPWAGLIQGVRFAMAPSRATTVKIDYIRLYHAEPASQLALNGAPASSLWWSDSPTLTPTPSQHAAPIPFAVLPGGTTADVSPFPPDSYFFTVANGQATEIGATIGHPEPHIDTPNVSGCGDYATAAIGHKWTFTSTKSVAKIGNATAVQFTAGGELSATNAGPQRNDPYVYLPVARAGINGRLYHRLTIVESYDGPFNLANKPGGGTMGRFIWLEPGQSAVSQTRPIVTYSGVHTITVDMALPAATLTDPAGSRAQRYPFATTKPVIALRWDPNEDPGARRWHVYSIRLAADCSTRTTYAMTWHDLHYTAGSTVLVQAKSPGHATVVLAPGLPEHAGENTYLVRAAALPKASWTLQLLVTGPDGQATGTSASGPLVTS